MVTAVDVGGTKTLVAQFDKTLRPVHEVRFETPKDQVDFFYELMRHLKRLSHITSIAVGVPGIVDSNGLIVRCGNLPWVNFDLKRVLFQQFRCPVFIDNDARLAALAEINLLEPLPSLGIYITVSTGIGGGVVANGRLIASLRTEPGHMMLRFKGEQLAWEDFASGSAIRAQLGHFAKDITDSREWQEVATRLSTGLLALIPAFQPEVIVFGGGVGQYVDHFGPFLAEQLHKNIPSLIAVPPILKAKHPQEAVLYGCYYYTKHRQDSIIY